MLSTSCPICNSRDTQTQDNWANRTLIFVCERCGKYKITQECVEDLPSIIGNSKHFDRFILSHAIRKQSDNRDFVIDKNWVSQVNKQKTLPRPQQQADLLIQYLGHDKISAGDWVPCSPTSLGGLLGTTDDPSKNERTGFTYVAENLEQKGLIQKNLSTEHRTVKEYRLTFDGWARLDEILNKTTETRKAFMAMQYNNAEVDQAFSHFVTAVVQTGYNLQRLDQNLKAGLIDMHMRVEIRAAKFLIADLSDDNRGAYWEAGFAEGLNKKVYYTCKLDKFERMKTHFDTEHLLTIKWSLPNIDTALRELKSAIRNDFPTEARLLD